MAPSRNLRGILTMIAAIGVLSLLDVGLKLLAAHYPPLQVAAMRGMASWPLILVWAAATTGLRDLLRVRWPLQLLRGVLMIGMMVCFVYGLRHLPLTTAYTLMFVAPLLITALSVPLLGEHVGRGRWLAILAGFGGVLVALRPSGDGLASLAGLAVLGAATAYALVVVTVRVLARSDSTISMVFWLLTVLSLGAGALAGPDWVAVLPAHAWIIAGVGIAGALGQYLITSAFSQGEASVVAPFEYSALAWGLGFDLLIWAVLPGATIWIGAAIIVASGLYLIRHERDDARPGSAPASAARGDDAAGGVGHG
ncbi:MAG TPA: DMT family transporter [Solimonas sp.]|nr:DMT family transporter [Solimonas sp.]